MYAIVGKNGHFCVFYTAMTGPGEAAKKTSFCILVGIYCHNIPACTPHSGYHGVAKVAKAANVAKMAEKCLNCISARHTPPHTSPMGSGAGGAIMKKKTWSVPTMAVGG